MFYRIFFNCSTELFHCWRMSRLNWMTLPIFWIIFFYSTGQFASFLLIVVSFMFGRILFNCLKNLTVVKLNIFSVIDEIIKFDIKNAYLDFLRRRNLKVFCSLLEFFSSLSLSPWRKHNIAEENDDLRLLAHATSSFSTRFRCSINKYRTFQHNLIGDELAQPDIQIHSKN